MSRTTSSWNAVWAAGVIRWQERIPLLVIGLDLPGHFQNAESGAQRLNSYGFTWTQFLLMYVIRSDTSFWHPLSYAYLYSLKSPLQPSSSKSIIFFFLRSQIREKEKSEVTVEFFFIYTYLSFRYWHKKSLYLEAGLLTHEKPLLGKSVFPVVLWPSFLVFKQERFLSLCRTGTCRPCGIPVSYMSYGLT
jgi:hypothetical protein